MHYRGAYSDAFLDGDVVSDRQAVWTQRLSNPTPQTETQLAEIDGALVGFVHTILEADPKWGALLDNLHVVTTHHRRGIGAALIARSAAFAAAARPRAGLYLWVLEQNVSAQRFYEAQGGEPADTVPVPAVGGVASRLNGTPLRSRFVWRNPSLLASAI